MNELPSTGDRVLIPSGIGQWIQEKLPVLLSIDSTTKRMIAYVVDHDIDNKTTYLSARDDLDSPFFHFSSQAIKEWRQDYLENIGD